MMGSTQSPLSELPELPSFRRQESVSCLQDDIQTPYAHQVVLLTMDEFWGQQKRGYRRRYVACCKRSLGH